MRTDLHQALMSDRDNVRLWAVYADWLESTGDPRGSLCSLMLRREGFPSRAMEEALVVQAPLLASITPESLKTLATRGSPRLAPIFRRGFLFSAGARQASDFEALIRDPSSAFLDTVILESDELPAWLATVDAPLPWRNLELNHLGADSIDLSSVAAHLPFLESLTLEQACDDVTFPSLPRLRRVRLRDAQPECVSALLETELPALEVLELLAPRGQPDAASGLDALAAELAPRLDRFSRVVLEGSPGEGTAALLQRSRHVFVRTSEPTERLFPVALQLELEASFAVFRSALTAEQREVLRAFAMLAGVSRLSVTQAPLVLGATTLHVVQLNGVAQAPFVPRTALQQLAKKARSLDGAAFTFSGSNNVASAWSVGPHVAAAIADARRRNTLPVIRRDESSSARHALTQSVIGALAGLDPGLDVLEQLLDALDFGTTEVLVGEPLASGERLPLFTDHEAAPEAEEEDYDEDEEDEELEDAYATEDDQWDASDPWGATPVNVPDFGPPEVALAEDEDDPEDDLGPPLHDAATADEEEIWVEGPVELPEHHDSLPGDAIVEPEVELLLRPNGEEPCPRCHQAAEVARCAQCLDDVCRLCAGTSAEAAWDDLLPFVCAQCEPISPGRFVRPR